MKQFFKFMLYGAAVTLGSVIVTKITGVFSNPYKKAKLKKVLKVLKTPLLKKIKFKGGSARTLLFRGKNTSFYRKGVFI